MRKKLLIPFIIMCLGVAGCAAADSELTRQQEVDVQELEEVRDESEILTDGKAIRQQEWEEEIWDESEMLTNMEAIQLVKDAQNAIKNVMKTADVYVEQEAETTAVRNKLSRYFDESILDYVLYVYQIREQDGQYVYYYYDEYRNFYMDETKSIAILHRGKDYYEVGVTFVHRWRRNFAQEEVPVKIELTERGQWVITEFNHWYNDFRYNYMPEAEFRPEYFTEELARELIEEFGTEADGSKVLLEVQNDENGYILPDSSERLIEESELEGKSRYELYLAVHEIYARHGKRFGDVILYEYFNDKPWYSPYEHLFSREELSDIEKKNIETLSRTGNLGEKAAPEYGSLYPVNNEEREFLTEEEASYIIGHLFFMADKVIDVKKENLIIEEWQDDIRNFTLGEYSSEEALKEYLCQYFSEEIFEYITIMYNAKNALWKNDDNNYTVSIEGTLYDDYYVIDSFERVKIKSADKDYCVVEVPFINVLALVDELPGTEPGEMALKRVGDDWIIDSVTHPFYDDLYERKILSRKDESS